MSDSATPWTAAHQAPPSLGFSRQEYWGGLPFPSPMHESEKWKWSCSSCARLLATPWTAAYQAPPSMGFSRQEYWSGLPLPSPYFHHPRFQIRCPSWNTRPQPWDQEFHISITSIDTIGNLTLRARFFDHVLAKTLPLMTWCLPLLSSILPLIDIPFFSMSPLLHKSRVIEIVPSLGDLYQVIKHTLGLLMIPYWSHLIGAQALCLLGEQKY